MQFGLILPNFGDYFQPRVLAALASDAEQAGWDGFFLWDHTVAWPTPIVDPWIAPEDMCPWSFGWQWEGDWPTDEMNAWIRSESPGV